MDNQPTGALDLEIGAIYETRNGEGTARAEADDLSDYFPMSCRWVKNPGSTFDVVEFNRDGSYAAKGHQHKWDLVRKVEDAPAIAKRVESLEAENASLRSRAEAAEAEVGKEDENGPCTLGLIEAAERCVSEFDKTGEVRSGNIDDLQLNLPAARAFRLRLRSTPVEAVPGMREALDNLLGAMDAWGSWEDGIPAEFAPVIATARKLLATQSPRSAQ